MFATGNGRKTDPVDAHSVALAALRAPNLVRVQADPELVVMGMLVDRRDELDRARTQTVNRLHRLLLELFPGGAKKFLSTTQARALVATTKPRDSVAQLRNPTAGRAYFDGKKAAGKTSMEAMRALKRRLSNIVYARMLADQKRREATGSGGQSGTTLQSSVTGLTPDTGPSDKPQPEPATSQPTATTATA